MCPYLGVSPSGYYAWRGRAKSRQAQRREELSKQIAREFKRSRQTYGSPRLSWSLTNQGYRCSRPLVAKLMREQGLRSRLSKTFVRTTQSDESLPVAPNLVNQEFAVKRPAQVWVSDITFVPTAQGWLYLTTVIDLFDRAVIGWAMSQTMKTEDTTMAATSMAIRNRRPLPDTIIHSDRGSQYSATAFRTLIKPYRQSMSRKGNCWDNAVAESFFKTLKYEWLNHQRFQTKEQAKLAIFDFIETWYNTQRIHSALNFQSPSQFYQQWVKSDSQQAA